MEVVINLLMNNHVTQKVKLIQKTSRTFLLTGLILIILSSIVLYFYTKNLLLEEIEEVLYSTETRVVDALEKGQPQYSLPPVIEINIVDNLRPPVLKDTIIYDPSQHELEMFRELSTFRKINNQAYQITVRNLVVESEDILIAIIMSNIIIYVLTFLILFYFNTTRNLKLWRPFFKNLEQMKSFSLTSNQPIDLTESDILEFSDLKYEIEQLTNKVRDDYQNLKQFTEDVSHEIQTPLAIIQAKIDNIINDSTISNEQFEQVSSIQKDVQRLKHLNKKITLLTKIDNNQFVNIENISINNLVENTIENFKELSVSEISYVANSNLDVKMDSYLAEILCNNLISNAVKHNIEKQPIKVEIKNNELLVSNSGEKPLAYPEKMFQRFYRENKNLQSTGLGLAIVKKICDFYGLRLKYLHKENKHLFSIKF